MIDHEAHQEKLSKLWGEHKDKAVTDDEGTYVNLENFSIGDYELDTGDARAPGNQSLSGSSDRKEGYFLSGGRGGNFRLFKR